MRKWSECISTIVIEVQYQYIIHKPTEILREDELMYACMCVEKIKIKKLEYYFVSCPILEKWQIMLFWQEQEENVEGIVLIYIAQIDESTEI